jgi:hypothetical protein
MEQIAQRKEAKTQRNSFARKILREKGGVREYEIKLLSCFGPLLCPAFNRVHPGPLPTGEGIDGIAALRKQ